MVTLKSAEFTLCSGSFEWGSIISFTFPYIFLLVDCFEWAVIGHIAKQSSLCPLAVLNGGREGVRFTLQAKSENLSCSEWALIGQIEKQRVHSVLWQFQMGGGRGPDLPPWGKSENLSSWMFRRAHQKGLFALHKTNEI